MSSGRRSKTQTKGSEGAAEVKQAEANPLMGGDLTTQITNAVTSMVPILVEEMLRSMVPIIAEEMTKKIHEERRVTEENEERLKKLKEDELQEWKNRKRFLSASPPVFTGVLDPIVVSDWIMQMENIFKICDSPDDRKVLYASFMLRGNALYWWNTSVKETMKTMLWDEFKELVNKNFSPKCLMRRLEEEFINLRQGDMSVEEYTSEFMLLARFAGLHVSTRERKIERFMEGLNAEIRSLLLGHKSNKTFEEVVEVAIIVEKGCRRGDGRQVNAKKARTWTTTNGKR